MQMSKALVNLETPKKRLAAHPVGHFCLTKSDQPHRKCLFALLCVYEYRQTDRQTFRYR